MSNIIDVENLSFSYSDKIILNQMNFSIVKGRTTLLLGPSGHGKTTLLKCLAYLNRDYSGAIKYSSRDLSTMEPKDRAHHIGYVAQNFALFPHFNVLKNVMHPLVKVLGYSSEEAQKLAIELLTDFELEDHFYKRPHELSGGQKQRVALARSLAMGPDTLLLDEPTSALDPISCQNFKQIIQKLQDKGKTIIISTHDLDLAKSVLDYVVLVNHGEIKDIYDSSEGEMGNNTSIYQYLYEHDKKR